MNGTAARWGIIYTPPLSKQPRVRNLGLLDWIINGRIALKYLVALAGVLVMAKKKILITGVTGLVGSVIRKSLKSEYEITGLDLRHCEDVPTLIADSTDLKSILPAYDGIDTVIDLASEPSNFASWEVIYENNLRCTYNALEAARLAGVKRVIFASSNHATGMYENDNPYVKIVEGQYEGIGAGRFQRVTTDMPIRPDGPYGIGKAFGEAAGRFYSDEYGLSVICIRIGTLNKESRPSGPRQFATLLTHADLSRLIRSCIEGPDAVKFAIYYGVSNNKWRFWDIENSMIEIGYQPEDDAEYWR
jgi:nucleoside-diphosphate-sugar epimerase